MPSRMLPTSSLTLRAMKRSQPCPGRRLRWWEHRSVHRKVAGSILRWGSYPGSGLNPWLGMHTGGNPPMFLCQGEGRARENGPFIFPAAVTLYRLCAFLLLAPSHSWPSPDVPELCHSFPIIEPLCRLPHRSPPAPTLSLMPGGPNSRLQGVR